MKPETLQGKVTFINHEKKYAIIEYLQNGKKKTVNGNIDEAFQKTLKEQNLIRKVHHFLSGDIVEFKIRISDRGERMIATNIKFLYNNALDELINKAKTTNKFIGYLKMVDDKYFIKEIDSYLFFPVPFSPWQIMPVDNGLNEQVTFSLENLDKKEKISARLYTSDYIPEFHTAVKYHKAKTPVGATVSRLTPHSVYLNIIGDKVQAKIPAGHKELTDVKPGDKIYVLISHISLTKIVVEPVSSPEADA